MHMKTERLQVLVDVTQRERLERAAAERGVSVASLVRAAIDVVYPPQATSRAKAAAAVLAADPMPAPVVDELVAELDELRGRRA
ncbi:MAG: antitoxin [Microbacterium sp.]|nr:MAG: antitoxin [Microbacterium sp.]